MQLTNYEYIPALVTQFHFYIPPQIFLTHFFLRPVLRARELIGKYGSYTISDGMMYCCLHFLFLDEKKQNLPAER